MATRPMGVRAAVAESRGRVPPDAAPHAGRGADRGPRHAGHRGERRHRRAGSAPDQTTIFVGCGPPESASRWPLRFYGTVNQLLRASMFAQICIGASHDLDSDLYVHKPAC